MVAPTLNVEEYQYDDTGVLLNGSTSLPFIDLHSIQGLDSGELRVQSLPREGIDGGYVEALFEGPRTVTLEGTIYAPPNDLDVYLDLLKVNFAPTVADKPLYFKVDHDTEGDRLIYGKSLGIKYSKDQLRRLGSTSCQIQIMCGDPRVYSVAAIQQSNAWTAGALSVVVGGNRTTPATLTITGPVTSPTITHNVTGAVFSFPGYTIAAGQTVVINLNNRSVIQQSTTNVRDKMTITGNWFLLSPGTNQFTKGGSGTTGATTLTVVTRSAWR